MAAPTQRLQPNTNCPVASAHPVAQAILPTLVSSSLFSASRYTVPPQVLIKPTGGSADSYTVLNLGGIGSDDAEGDSDDVITTADNTATSATATPTADQTPTSVAKEEASEATGSALTTNGIIIPNSVSPDSIPTGILTAASSTDKETTTASSTLSTATHSASSASSSSATPTPTGNAAGTLRAPVAGIFAVGLALVV